MYKCYVDRNIHLSNESIEQLSKNGISIEYLDIKQITSPERISHLLIHSQLPSKTLSKLSNCEYIGIRAKNTDYINIQIAKEKNILVKGLEHQHGVHSVAEHTLALILALSKRLVPSNNNTKNKLWKTGLPLNTELQNKTIAIIGTGQIGSRVAEISKVFGMNIVHVGKTGNLKVNQLNLTQALPISDIVSIHTSAPSHDSTLIGLKELQLIKDNAILINTARGSVLDYDALNLELKKGRFMGVGLDVFPQEPLLNNDYLKYDNVITTPHFAYYTSECLEKMNNELIEQLVKQIKNT